MRCVHVLKHSYVENPDIYLGYVQILVILTNGLSCQEKGVMGLKVLSFSRYFIEIRYKEINIDPKINPLSF